MYSFCGTPARCAASHCPGCQAKVCRGALPVLYELVVATGIVVGGVCSSAVDGVGTWSAWTIGLAVMAGGWSVLDIAYADRVRFRRSRHGR